jgi:hypothetical protein
MGPARLLTCLGLLEAWPKPTTALLRINARAYRLIDQFDGRK